MSRREAPVMPVRTCVGCRQRAVTSDLLRVVAVEGRLVPDPRRRMPGRGAHLHPDPACFDLAERRRAFPRALRLPGPLDATAVAEAVARQEGTAIRARLDEEAGRTTMSAR